ncbi:DNA (cytosine-5-)-methyltransferase, partial [mine drainage metagenome]
MSAGRKEALTAGDLFCGAGGFAEGFEQAGFRVAWGVDNWHPAVETFQKNHPRATVLEKDLLSLDPAELTRLGKVDVLIGSPPCTHFSVANKGGNGDRRAGMLLVQRFLTFVQALKPRYWVMENVPGLQKDLDPVVREGHIQLDDGPLKIPAREVLDSAEFGAPQSRRRLYAGSFPLPSPVASYSEGNVPKLRSILETLPNPREDVGASRDAVHDPVYDREQVPRASLRDHFEDTRWALTQDEVDSSIRERETHRIYGKMPFPDSPDRPCRTVTATRTRESRSTIVIPYPDRKEVPYRTLTLRECASAQGFPLAYQFWATSMSDKDALVGNAVTPPVARAIANAILLAEDREPAATPAVKQVGALPPIVTVRRIGPKRFSMTRRFRGIVPVDWAHEHRVELDNEFPRP